MRTLYVSDLDGTLLRSDERASEYTNNVINRLVARGMIFSYATARSFETSHRVTQGLSANFPLIIYNGAMVIDNQSGEFLMKNFFDESAKDIVRDLVTSNVYPIIYGFVDGVERFSYIPEKCGEGMRAFVDSRRGDRRERQVFDVDSLLEGELFYFTCIDSREKLAPLYDKYRERYHCVFQEEIYTQSQWLEIMPKAASKANAVAQLKARLGCEKLVVFGDGKNDIDMFEIADEAYAVSNAVDELKCIATAVIGSNDSDGVARWLEKHAVFDER